MMSRSTLFSLVWGEGGLSLLIGFAPGGENDSSLGSLFSEVKIFSLGCPSRDYGIWGR